MTTQEEKANLAFQMMKAGWKNRRKMAWIAFGSIFIISV